jgi:hypothetical protein
MSDSTVDMSNTPDPNVAPIVTEAAPEETPRDNPAWGIDAFPEGFRGVAREKFSEFDRNHQQGIQKVHEQYAPYKQFLDAKVDPAKLEQAYQFAISLEQDPAGVTKMLAQHLGLSIQEAEAVIADAEQEQQGDPQLTAMQAKLQEMENFIASQQQQTQQEQLIAEQNNLLDQGFASIEKSIGGALDPQVKNAVLRQMFYNQEITGKPADIFEAFQQVNEFVTQIRAVPRPGESAPRVVHSGNTVQVAAPGKKVSEMSDSERRAYAATVAARVISG